MRCYVCDGPATTRRDIAGCAEDFCAEHAAELDAEPRARWFLIERQGEDPAVVSWDDLELPDSVGLRCDLVKLNPDQSFMDGGGAAPPVRITALDGPGQEYWPSPMVWAPPLPVFPPVRRKVPEVSVRVAEVSVTTYTGYRIDNVCVVTVDHVTPLPPRFDLRNHSPSGFQWGYEGSGPAQLALALLAHALEVPEDVGAYRSGVLGRPESVKPFDEAGVDCATRVLMSYQLFKRKIVAGWKHDTFEISKAEILETLARIEALSELFASLIAGVDERVKEAIGACVKAGIPETDAIMESESFKTSGKIGRYVDVDSGRSPGGRHA